MAAMLSVLLKDYCVQMCVCVFDIHKISMTVRNTRTFI